MMWICFNETLYQTLFVSSRRKMQQSRIIGVSQHIYLLTKSL